MKLIKPSFEIIEQTPGIQGIKKQIELAGRTCYKSEDKITDTSCEEFVNRMVNSGHGAMLEHGTVYLKFPNDTYEAIDLMASYDDNKYSKVNYDTEYFYITTNYRVLVENNWLDDLQYQCEPTEYHEKRITVKFICDRGVSHEFVRHRTMSFAQESTRYCNYSKDKFGNEITCILPPWELEGAYLEFEEDLKVIESIYFKWINKGWKAQEARYFLPTGVKTELVVTGFVSDWEHFLKLRCHSTAHPQARELAIPLQEEFIKKGYING
jgi:thymidylate synthase (FAD)